MYQESLELFLVILHIIKQDQTVATEDATEDAAARMTMVLRSQRDAADAYSAAGMFNEALELYKQVFLAWRNMIPMDKHMLTYAVEGLAVGFRQMGNFKAAVALAEDALSNWRCFFTGPMAKSSPAIRILISTLIDLDRFAEALSLSDQCLVATREVYPGQEDHPRLLSHLFVHASILMHLERYDEALAVSIQVLNARKRVPSSYRFALLESMDQVAYIYALTDRGLDEEHDDDDDDNNGDDDMSPSWGSLCTTNLRAMYFPLNTLNQLPPLELLAMIASRRQFHEGAVEALMRVWEVLNLSVPPYHPRRIREFEEVR
jgi:tetratricopeptide (TPR) repeat protein